MPRKKKLDKLDPATARDQVFAQFAQLLRITQAELDRLESLEGDRKLSASGLQAILSVHRNALELIAQAEAHERQQEEEKQRAESDGMSPEERQLLAEFNANLKVNEPDPYQTPEEIQKSELKPPVYDPAKDKSATPEGY